MAADSSPLDQTKQRKPRKSETIVSRRNQPLRRVWRFIRATWIWFTILFIIIAALSDREFLNAVLLVGQTVGQLLLLLSFAILQFVAIFWFMARSKTEVIKPEDPKSLTFDDYKGQPQLLKLVRQWITLLSDRTKFQDMGGRFVTGILLYGPPGTGKTYLAKAMAGEAGVAFISIEGSGFRAMFFGVDVLKMIAFIRKARKLAREYGACIAYIDEIDSVGQSRGGVMGGQTTMGMGRGGFMGGMGGGTGALTRLLYEMDGVDEKTRGEKFQAWYYTKILKKAPPQRDWNVLFMGSTNRPDVLDPALTRPGRFDRSIEVSFPDRTGRRAIVDYYLGRIKSDDSVDLEAIVADTPGYTPAQIMAAITKDAVRIAIFDDRDTVSQRDIDMAFQEQASGLENPIEELDPQQREQIAYHEAGHALAVYYLFPNRRIVRASIIRRANSLGHVRSVENIEIYAKELQEGVREIMVSLSGDIATRLKYFTPWTGMAGGRSSDYGHVRYWLAWLGEHGFFGPPVDNPSALYQKEMQHFWKDAEMKTERLLKEHWSEIDAIAQALLIDGDLPGKEIVRIIKETSVSNGHNPEEAQQVVQEVVAEKAADQTPGENSPEAVPVSIPVTLEHQTAN